ncbi:MAG: hypothetical protein Aureis2KO_24490 [Aureisphaera sp.]
MNAQSFDLDDAPNLWGPHNQIASTGFNLKGVTIEKGKNYFNTLGKANQGLSWDVLTGKIWVNQLLYDRHGRPALQTLNAPISGGLVMDPNFILNSSNNSYTTNDFDIGGTVNNPSPVGSSSPLQIFYSPANTDNLYQDITSYPFIRAVYSKLNSGSGQKILGGNKINGEWVQAYSFSMDSGSELSAPNAFGNSFNNNTRVTKNISRDVNSTEVVEFKDGDGNVIATAKSGNTLEIVPFTNEVYIGAQGYVDIHIPEGITDFTIYNPSSASSGTLRVYDLVTDSFLQNVTETSATLSTGNGFYRIAVSTPLNYGKNAPNTIKIEHEVNYYDYSLASYDQMHRMIKRTQPLSKNLVSTYEFNSIGEVLSTQNPDKGFSQFLYRKDGQIRYSENASNSRRVHYTNYDELGRSIESGVFTWTGAFLALDPDGPNISGLDTEYETHTLYDVPDLGTGFDIPTCPFPFAEYKQTFVAGNVSKTYSRNPNTSTTWFSYDVQGRVTWVVQKIDGMDCYKTIDYIYDPATGQVIEVDFQRHEPNERFIHKYEYNNAGQLVTVHTSRTGMDSDWTEQARYTYGETGELIRTVLAEDLQGIDNVYNLNGQLKAINSPTLDPFKDPGGDGKPGSTVAADVFGFAIDYYNGDYTRTGTPTPISTENTHGTDQYNGNIKGVRFNTSTSSSSFGGFDSYMYQYNKNNWLQGATFGAGSISTSGDGYQVNFVPNANNDYEISGINYDANGNILSLKRNGYTGKGSNNMDDFQYLYDGNQLQNVLDTGDNTDPDRYNDLRDQSNNGAPNYTYTAIGQLYSDIEGRAIYEYTPSGLVSKISTFGDNTDPNAQFTLYYQNHQEAGSEELDFWSVSSGTKQINDDGTYGGAGILPSCATLDNLYGKSMEFHMPDNATVTRTFDVLDGVPQTLDLSIIVDQYKELVEIGEANEKPAGYVITLYDGPVDISIPTILETRSYNTDLQYIDDISLPNTSECSGLYTRQESFSFTPTKNKVTLTLRKETISDQLPLYIDNIELRTGILPIMEIVYNDRRQRTKKTVYNPNGNTYSTYYLRDLGGNITAVYSATNTNEPDIKEIPVYGSNRIGDYLFNSFQPDPPSGNQGTYRYQITDHLGNVRAVLSKAIDGTPIMLAKTDYYPFGMPMPSRTQEGSYRYAFQGQEKDPETGMEAFQLRLWDNRIGRWLSIDPAAQFHSPYQGMGNNPINGVDPDGAKFVPIGKIAKTLWAFYKRRIARTERGKEIIDMIENDEDWIVKVKYKESAFGFIYDSDTKTLYLGEMGSGFTMGALATEGLYDGNWAFYHSDWVIAAHEVWHSWEHYITDKINGHGTFNRNLHYYNTRTGERLMRPEVLKAIETNAVAFQNYIYSVYTGKDNYRNSYSRWDNLFDNPTTEFFNPKFERITEFYSTHINRSNMEQMPTTIMKIFDGYRQTFGKDKCGCK